MNRTETVLKKRIIPICSLGKNPRNSPFFLCVVIRGKSRVITCLFPLPMAITQRRKKENSLCIFFKSSLIRNVSFGTSSSWKICKSQFHAN